MTEAMSTADGRIDRVDALRGTALIGLFLVHMVEHFDLLRYPEGGAPWLRKLDGWVNEAVFFLFAGKSYAIFAMMFGISFTLILQSWSKTAPEGTVRLRFLWRLLILGAMGYVHGLLYIGDILSVLAVLGLPLILIYRLPDRLLWLLAGFLLIQVPSVWATVSLLLAPETQPSNPSHWALYGRLFEVSMKAPLLEMLHNNLWTGQTARFWFFIESGRGLQMAGLFVIGLLVGRHRLYIDSPQARGVWVRMFKGSLVAFALLYPLSLWVNALSLKGMARYEATMLTGAWANLALTFVWASGFALVWPQLAGGALARHLVSYGRMSLTCYLMQALIWVPVFYGFGLGYYKEWGVTVSVAVGIVFVVAQMRFADLWMRHFRYGPAEWFWRCATFRRFDFPLRRVALQAA